MTARTATSEVTLLTELPQPSSAYKRRVWLAVLGLLGFMTAYLVLAGWFVYTAWRLTLAADTIAFEGYLVAGCSLFLGAMMLKGIFFVKHGGTDGSVEITEEQQPRLFRFLHNLADTAQAPRPHRVFLAPNVNAAVFYDLSPLNLIFPSKKNLEIGLGLVNALTLGELRAVLAHEFGHFTQSSMAVFRWSYLAQQIAAHLVARRDKLDEFLVRLSHWDVRVAWVGWVLSLIVWSIRSLVDTAFGLVILLQRALSREMEFQADLVSVSLSGSDALIHALHRLQAADDSWDRTLGIVGEQHSKGRVPRDAFTLHTRIMQRMGEILGDSGYGKVPPVPADRPESHRLFKPELAQPPKMWLTHPLNHDREANAKENYIHAPIDERSAWQIFDNVEALREEVTAAMIGPDASTPIAIEESLEAIDTYFAREFLDSRYRGSYLGRSITRCATTPAALVETGAIIWQAQIEQLYPESLVKDVAQLRAFEKELSQLRAIHMGVLAPAEGGIRHRGRVIKPGELPAAMKRVEHDVAAVEKRLVAHDRLCRSAHLGAARELGQGWAEYLQGLIAAIHYGDHTAANLQDLQGVLGHTVHVATVTGRIGNAGRKRVVAAANALQEALLKVFAQSREVTLDSTLAQRLGNTSWADILGKFELGQATEENIGDWLSVIDGWTSQAGGPADALRTEALEQLLLTEASIAGHVRAGTHPGPAPAPSKMPAKYETLLSGKERERKDAPSWWDRFQTADGKVAATARVAVAATIVIAVLGFGGTMGSSTITVYNGLAIPVFVDIAGTEVMVAPGGTQTHPISTAGLYPIATRTRGGKNIERFDAEIPGSFGNFVYNIAGAAPLVEWTATYGNAEPEPDSILGAPRWARTSAQLLFRDPPDTVKTKGGGARRRMLTAITDPPPSRQVAIVDDSLERARLAAMHARWDATSSEHILGWLSIAQSVAPDFPAVVAARLAEKPGDVVLLRAEQDAAKGEAHDAVCERHMDSADAAPDSADLFYLAARCIEEDSTKARTFIEAHRYWPTNPWLAYAAGYTYMESARWAEAVPALESARRTLKPVSKYVVLDLARLHRLLGDGRAMTELAKGSDELQYMIALETGKGLGDDPMSAYAALARGEIDAAMSKAGADSTTEVEVLRLAAASDGASEELQTRALALDAHAGIDNNTRWAAIGLAMRKGQDHARFHPPVETVSAEYMRKLLAFVERARADADPMAAESELLGLTPVMRGHAFSVATIVLGDRTPEAWRTGAKKLLFASERPFFR